MPNAFVYEEAFSRNIGWLTEAEQARLRTARVAIGGMGGVGGGHLLALVRLGIGRFTIADYDTFDLVNFNRQVGATTDTIGRSKTEVMAEMALAINPELDIRKLPSGVDMERPEAFLDGADLFVDGLDFYALEERRKIHAFAWKVGMPSVIAAPLGMSVSLIAFVPGHMSFEEYFRLAGHPEPEQARRFLDGLAPAAMHEEYLMDRSRFDFAAKSGPSIGAACNLCSGAVGLTALKLLIDRGEVPAAPVHQHWDLFTNQFVTTVMPAGLSGPGERLRAAERMACAV